jgi:hypothetical protein
MSLENIFSNWKSQSKVENDPEIISVKTKIYNLIPEWNNSKIYCIPTNLNGNYVFHRDNYGDDFCCIVNSQSGIYILSNKMWKDHVPNHSKHIKTLDGLNLLGEPIELIFCEYTGLYMLHIYRPTSEWACEYDAHGYLFFENINVLMEVINWCLQTKDFKFQVKLTEDTEDVYLSSDCRDLTNRYDDWYDGDWVNLQNNGSNGIECFEDDIIKTVDEFSQKFAYYNCESWHCDICRKSYGITELSHCFDCAINIKVEGQYRMYAYNQCKTCKIKPHEENNNKYQVVKHSSEHRMISGELTEILIKYTQLEKDAKKLNQQIKLQHRS